MVYMTVLGTTFASLAALAAARGVVPSPVTASRQPFHHGMTARSSGSMAMIYAIRSAPNAASPRLSGSSSNPGQIR